MQLGDRNIEQGVIGVLELEKLGIAFSHIEIHQAQVAPNPVLNMDDWIALLEFGEVANDRINIRFSVPSPTALPSCNLGEEFALGADYETTG
jgi:hypothetical protein